MTTADSERLQRAELSLEGLSVGDSFGQMFFGPEETVRRQIERRQKPASPWWLTDDSIMAVGVTEILRRYGAIDQDALAQLFAANHARSPQRGYGATTQSLLRAVHDGGDWRELAPALFSGGGSYGNGAAMRVAPLGAYFADDLERLLSQAILSAEVTHSHPEGQAGAIAVAAAAAWAWNHRGDSNGRAMLEFAFQQTPAGETRAGLSRALRLSLSYHVETAVSALGNGRNLSSQDTVPFALWCAARCIGDFEEAMWTTVRGLGDRDTTCAIVGGVVALAAEETGPPAEWKESREPLDDWRRLSG